MAEKDTVRRTADTARRASDAAQHGSGELWILSQENLESMAEASQAMLKGTSDLGSVWGSFWNEQLTSGMEAMRSLAECHSWDEALTVQNEFTRASLERVSSRVVRSAEVTAEMLTSSLVPLRESARRAAERMPRSAT